VLATNRLRRPGGRGVTRVPSAFHTRGENIARLPVFEPKAEASDMISNKAVQYIDFGYETAEQFWAEVVL